MIFAIDFDGTIVENRYPQIGKVNLRGAQFIRELKRLGHVFVLWTCRSGAELDAAVCYLKAMGLAPDYVNENVPELCAQYGNNCRKVFADYYIDDRNPGGVVWPFKALVWRGGK